MGTSTWVRKNSQFSVSKYLVISWKNFKIGQQLIDEQRLLWNVSMKSEVPDRSVSVPMTFSDPERRGAKSSVLHTYARTVQLTAIKFGMVTRLEKGGYGRVRHPPTQKAGPQCAPIFGISPAYAHILCNITTKSGVVTYTGRSVFR